MEMVQLTQKASDVPILQVQTTGWAATVIETWIHDCQTKQKLNASKPKRSNFCKYTNQVILSCLK